MSRSDQDRVRWTLTDHSGSMAKSDLARRLQMRPTELDVVLQDLERAGKVKLTEKRGKLVVGLRDGRGRIARPPKEEAIFDTELQRYVMPSERVAMSKQGKK